MSVTITSAEVFSESDAERPCATVQRVGGGRFVAVLYSAGVPVDKVEADSYDAAIVLAEKHGADIDEVPTTSDEKIALTRTIREKQAEIDALTARVAELETARIEAARTEAVGGFVVNETPR